MNKLFIIALMMLVCGTGFSQDSLKKTFLFVELGGLKQINTDDNERSYYGYWAGAGVGFKTRKHLLVQTGLEYYRVRFYAKYMNSGPGTSDNKQCIPVQ